MFSESIEHKLVQIYRNLFKVFKGKRYSKDLKQLAKLQQMWKIISYSTF